MTRKDSVASYGRLSKESSRMWRKLPIAAIALLIAAVLLVPATALAAESTSGYSQTAPPPKTTTTPPATTPTTPATGTSPSKEEKTTSEKTTPSKETSPTSTTPTSSGKASTLPFTGFDLRWTIGGGLLLIGAGFSLVMVERRQRRNPTR
jgi:cytoskeletal protein RodZ